MEFDRIDINQCPPGLGNSGPNRFADTARCKKETTEVFLHLQDFLRFNTNKIIFSVNQYMDGVSEEGGISVDVNRVLDYRCKYDDRFWVKLSKEQRLNSITTVLIARKLDVRKLIPLLLKCL